MMKKSNSKSGAMLKYALLLPTVALLVGVNVMSQERTALNSSAPPTGNPITDITTLKVSGRYGERSSHMHQGIDFAAKTGTAVQSTANGTVEEADFDRNYGNYVRLKHNETFSTLYAHLSRIAVKKGDNVTQGQVIGYVGNTGRSTGPHLHYEVWKNGENVNPEDYLSLVFTVSDKLDAALQTQQPPVPSAKADEDIYTVITQLPKNDEEPFMSVDSPPEFPGGINALYQFLSENLVYPAAAHAKGIQGRTVVRFVVEKDGSVNEVEVMRGFDYDCDAAAVRVVKSLPKWVPGTQKGKAVRVYYTVPITFRLNGEPAPTDNDNQGVVAIGYDKKTGEKWDNVLQLRGDKKPMIVLDDKVMPADYDLQQLNIDDVESITVLKDEPAIKIYGDKGKNGVILITTKKK